MKIFSSCRSPSFISKQRVTRSFGIVLATLLASTGTVVNAETMSEEEVRRNRTSTVTISDSNIRVVGEPQYHFTYPGAPAMKQRYPFTYPVSDVKVSLEKTSLVPLFTYGFSLGAADMDPAKQR